MIVTARYVYTADGPLIESGALRVTAGRITWVGRRSELSPVDLAGDDVRDLGEALLTPGLINAHAHLELSALAGRIRPSGLWTWLARLVKLRRQIERSAERQAARRAAEDALACGVTCIADISRRGDTWQILRELPMRTVCFTELITIARDAPRTPAELDDHMASAAARTQGIPRLSLGVSPHAPYTVSCEHLSETAALARRRGLPLTTHWAETKEECRWLARGGGRLGALLWTLGAGGRIRAPRRSPMAYADQAGLLDAASLLAHVNYMDDDDLATLAASRACVAYCPRSHRFFGHRGHRWRDMLDAGVLVCVGTDSLASLPPGSRLSMLDEMALLRDEAPELPAEVFWRMVTLNAATALGLDTETGSLAPGKAADLVAWPVTDATASDPLADVIASRPDPTAVWVDGSEVSLRV